MPFHMGAKDWKCLHSAHFTSWGISSDPSFVLLFSSIISLVLEDAVQCAVIQRLPYLPPSLLTQLYILFLFKSIETNLCCPDTLECVTFYWSRVYLPGVTFVEKTDSLSRNCRLSIVPKLRMGLSSHLLSSLCAGIWSGLNLRRSCACCHNC